MQHPRPTDTRQTSGRPVKYPYVLAEAACSFLKETNLIPRARQASATSITGMPTIPKSIRTSRDFSECAISCAPVCIGGGWWGIVSSFVCFLFFFDGTGM